NGHLEIVLAGIHTGRYGNGTDKNLTDLLKRLVKEVPELKRIRISSIEMNEISDELLDFMKVEEKIARHLHIPVQCANTKILTLMHRPYDVEYFQKRIDHIREVLGDISISSDVIVGFPQESEEDFLDTMQNIKKMNFSFLHIFPYSKRDGTVAAQKKGHVENKERTCI
ncbi:MAG: radical SAM protein, partial [Longicatena sp.]